MRLLIISAMPHYSKEGTIVGWGPTVREIDRLAELFDSLRHIAFLYPEEAPDTSLPYSTEKMTLIPVAPSGGKTFLTKLGVLALFPRYLATIRRELAQADMVHLRAPANISLLAILLLMIVQRPRRRWIKFAGNWQPSGPEPWSYRLQRFLLRKPWHSGVVTINGQWPGQAAHVLSFLNPSLSQDEVAAARAASADKRLGRPLRLLFVGRLVDGKGVGVVLELARRLLGSGLDFTLDLAGDGPQRAEYEAFVHTHGLEARVKFHGWLAPAGLNELYRVAHCLVFPSASEGWPKVLSEAMAYGVVAVASAVSSIPQILEQTGGGLALPLEKIEVWEETLLKLAADPDLWLELSRNGRKAAARFTFDAYLEAVRALIVGQAPKIER